MKLACPKCKSGSLELTERMVELEIHAVVDGVIEKDCIDHQPEGSLGWSASCLDCGHVWTPRRKTIESATEHW